MSELVLIGASFHRGDCLVIAPTLSGMDACVCDPPYGLGFMGKNWDHGVPGVEFWIAIMQACKPGAHLLAFGGTRTFHRLACAIEDAGWELRDTIMWVYGSGFPKSLDVSKAIDAAAGVERNVVAISHNGSGAQPHKLNAHKTGDTGIGYMDGSGKTFNITEPNSDAAKKWNGWGTSLKPAWEPIIVARKPFDGTVAENVQIHGTGAINVDECRVEGDVGSGVWGSSNEGCQAGRSFNQSPDGKNYRSKQTRPLRVNVGVSAGSRAVGETTVGRWPANLIHDGSEEVLKEFPNTTSGFMAAGTIRNSENKIYGKGMSGSGKMATEFGSGGDSGSAARFFYCAKADKQDRNEGCEQLPDRTAGQCTDRKEGTAGLESPRAGAGRTTGSKNHHPTVKPTDLMRYLCRLVTPPGGTVFDPFMGSGSTGKAAILEGFRFVGIELDADNAGYLDIAKARIQHAIEIKRCETAQQTFF